MFPKMAEIIPEGKDGDFAIEYFTVTEEDAERYNAFYCGPQDRIKAGTYARLMRGNKILMSDTPMEHRSNRDFVRAAHGRVLVVGLGLGMVLKALPPFNVTVVEKNPEVVRLVWPHLNLPESFTVEVADIHEWEPPEGKKFDTLYFDIWGDYSSDTYEEHEALKRRFKPYRAKGSWCECWMGEEVRDLAGC